MGQPTKQKLDHNVQLNIKRQGSVAGFSNGVKNKTLSDLLLKKKKTASDFIILLSDPVSFIRIMSHFRSIAVNEIRNWLPMQAKKLPSTIYLSTSHCINIYLQERFEHKNALGTYKYTGGTAHGYYFLHRWKFEHYGKLTAKHLDTSIVLQNSFYKNLSSFSNPNHELGQVVSLRAKKLQVPTKQK